MANSNQQSVLLGVEISDQSIDDLAKLKKKIDSLKEAKKGLNKTTEEGRKQNVLIDAQIKALTKTYNKQMNALIDSKKQLTGFNKYWSEFKTAATGALGSISRGFSNFAKMIVTNPIGAAVTAIVLVFNKLRDAFRNSDSAMTALSKGMALFQPILNLINNALNATVDALAKIINKTVEWASKFSPTIKAAKELAEAQDELEERLRQHEILYDKNAVKLAELNNVMRDSTKSIKERNEAAAQAILLERDDTLTKQRDKMQEFINKWQELSDATGKGRLSFQNAFGDIKTLAFDTTRTIDVAEKSIENIQRQIETADFNDTQKDTLNGYLKAVLDIRKEYINSIRRAEQTINQAEKEFNENLKERAKENFNIVEDEKAAAREMADVNQEILDKINETSDAAHVARKDLEKKVIDEGNALGALWAKSLTENLDKEEKEQFKRRFEQFLVEYNKIIKEGLFRNFPVLEDSMSFFQQMYNDIVNEEDEVPEKDFNAALQYLIKKKQNEGATEEEILGIRIKYLKERLKILDKESDEYQDTLAVIKNDEETLQKSTVTKYINMAQQITEAVSSIYSNVGEIQRQQIEDNLQTQLDAFDSERNALDAKLQAGLISEEDYNSKVKKLDAERQKAQNKANYETQLIAWRNSLLQASTQIALGIAKSIAESPWTGGLPGSAIAAAMGAVQLATIAANKPAAPKYGKGGLLQGKSHAQGGILIEAEGGEAIINKKSTKRFASLLSEINQAGGGVSIPSKGKKGIFAKGGTVNDGGYGIKRLTNRMQYPPIYVAVTDINRGQENYAKVVENKII